MGWYISLEFHMHTQNSYGWIGAFEISRHVSWALLSNLPVWYCFNCLHLECVKLYRFHSSNKRPVFKVHNCLMHYFHKFANLFCLFFRSLCTKTRELVEMRWPEEPLYLPVDRYGCPYDGSLGAILNSRYIVICKLGWGHHSNVWLAHDVRWEIEYNVPDDFSSRAESLESRYWQLMPHHTFLMSLGSFSVSLSRWG